MIEITELNVGTILHFRDPESYDVKGKFSVIVGVSDDHYCIATVFINSVININKINSPELVTLQVKLEASKYKNFLKVDSYVNCADVKHRMQRSFLEELNLTGRIIGKLSDLDLKEIISKIMGSDTISPYYLKLYNITQ